MLEQYFVRPETIDRIRSSWIGEPIERYVAWLTENRYRPRNVFRRVPILVQFGEFAASRGACALEDLPSHVASFVGHWVDRCAQRSVTAIEENRKKVACDARNPVEQMLSLVLEDFQGSGRPRMDSPPFADRVPGFFTYLRQERGLREETVRHYEHHLRPFERYLVEIDLTELAALSPPLLSAFVVQRCASLGKTGRRDACSTVRVFLRYLHREGFVAKDLSSSIEAPQAYRLSTIPRSIRWDEVSMVLEVVDRRTPIGKRDFAILLLLVTYGLRAREVVALTLDDIDWRGERLRIPERKAGHSTAFPLSSVVGEALLDYLKHGRPETNDRYVFQRALAPLRPLTHSAVSSRAGHYLRKAGIDVLRPGSHSLRHTCVQRMVDGDFSFKTIGDYIGHRSPSSTAIYSKVATGALREVALGDGEEIL